MLDPRTKSGQRVLTWSGRVGHRVIRRHDLGVVKHSVEVTVAMDARGRSYVLWFAQPQGPDYTIPAHAPWQLRGASISPGGKAATPVQSFADGEETGGNPTIAASPTTGGAVVEYADSNEQGHLVIADADGIFAPAAADIPRSANPGPVAYMPDGTAYATWSDPTANKTYAAIVNANGLESTEDTGLRAPHYEPGFAPDDHSLLISGSPTGQPRIYIVASNNDHARLLSSTRVP
ncbi:MAG: hypothetical protein QM679_09525 [Patulibacter sp.]